MVARRIPEKAFAEQWELTELAEDTRRVLNLDLPIEDWGREEGIDETQIRERIEQAADQMMAAKAANLGPDLMRFIEKSLLMQVLDAVWKEHLYALDHLRQGIGLRAYGQRDPLNEYKSEAFALFNAMLDELKERVTAMLARVQISPERPPEPDFQPRRQAMFELHPEPMPAHGGGASRNTSWSWRCRAGRSGPSRYVSAPPPAEPTPWTRMTRPPGATRRATPRARAGRARNTSTVTGGSLDGPVHRSRS